MASDVTEDATEQEQPEAEGAPDLAELGRRYAAPSGFTEALRNGFRELKRHPNETKRLVTLLRGLARKHEPEARIATQQITHLVAGIQKRSDS